MAILRENNTLPRTTFVVPKLTILKRSIYALNNNIIVRTSYLATIILASGQVASDIATILSRNPQLRDMPTFLSSQISRIVKMLAQDICYIPRNLILLGVLWHCREIIVAKS